MTNPPPSGASGPAPRSRRARVASTLAGAVIGLGAAAFVVRALLRDRDDAGDALGEASLGWLALALVLGVTGMVAIALPWRRVLAVLGADVTREQVLARYFVGEIGKYVPGGVWPVLGRGELARRAGVTGAVAYGSVLLSLFALYFAAVVVGVAGLPWLLGAGPAVLGLVVVLPLGVAALHPRVLGRVVEALSAMARRPVGIPTPPWATSLGLVAAYVPAWLAIGGATWAVARAFDPAAGVADVATAAVLSWIAGFVAVPVPGGVGVREAVFLAATALDPGVAVVVTILARLLFVVVDTAGAALGSTRLRARA